MMPEKNPFFTTIADLLTYAWVFGLAMLGGAASFVRRVRSGQAKYSNIIELIGELVVSAFAGLVTFFLCRSANFDEMLTAAFIAISGHMGTRIIFMFEAYLVKKIGLNVQTDSKIEDSKNGD
ncbi:MAG: phage holin family protein [Agitococcus sp.]|nr:phage holin family protein [Agitococcus sp.]